MDEAKINVVGSKSQVNGVELKCFTEVQNKSQLSEVTRNLISNVQGKGPINKVEYKSLANGIKSSQRLSPYAREFEVKSRNGSFSLSNEIGCKSNIREKNLCRCGSMFNVSEESKIGLVELFEHVHASGQYNYACCRIPVKNSKLNIPAWRDKLSSYEDKVVCEL